MPDILTLARELGFEQSAEFDAEGLVFREDVRAMCADGRCRRYGRSWSCPPAIGPVAKLEERARAFARGVLVQTTGALEDEFDAGGIAAASQLHKRRFEALARQAKAVSKNACLPLGAGSCTLCVRCTYPSWPCRHPERVYPSMEACGLLVADVCALAGLGYNYGPCTITYSSCILYNQGD